MKSSEEMGRGNETRGRGAEEGRDGNRRREKRERGGERKSVEGRKRPAGRGGQEWGGGNLSEEEFTSGAIRCVSSPDQGTDDC